MTGEGKIRKLVTPSVLFGDDVLDVMRNVAEALVQTTVFASAKSSLPNLPSGFDIHLVMDLRESPLSLEFQDCDEIRRIDQSFVL